MWEKKEKEVVEMFIRGIKPQITEEEIVGAIAILSGFIKDVRLDFAKERCDELRKHYESSFLKLNGKLYLEIPKI